MKHLHRATLNVSARSEEGVERSAAGAAPSAFRIWRAGENKCDDGSVFFTEESAKLLMAEQEAKARLLSIDYDHLSLADNRPAEAGQAAGWHSIEARDTDAGPELWAVNVEWCQAAKDGLEQQPPTWRFFSPAFYTDDEQQITKYINLALCINPMTHGIPLLASRKLTQETTMPTAEEMLVALDAMIDAATDDNQKAALVAAREALAAKKSVDDPPDSSKDLPAAASANADGAITHAEGDDKKDDDKPKTDSVKTHSAKGPAVADSVASLTAQVMRLERRAEVNEIDVLLSKHANLPDEFRAHCRKGTIEQARANISAVAGVVTHSRKDKPSQGSTDGTAALDPRDADFMDRQMGLKSGGATMPHKRADGSFVLHNVRPSDMARMNAQKAKA